MKRADVTLLRLVIVPGLLLLAVAMTACAGQPERLWLKAPGWSRAQLIDNTRVGDPVPVTVDDAGNVYLFLVSAENGTSDLRVVAMDRQAQVLWDRTYGEIELAGPAEPWIVWDGEVLQLFWIDDHKLYNVSAGPTGTLLGEPALLSGDTTVGDYDVSSDDSGLTAVWYAGPRDEPGVYALPAHNLAGQATLVDPEGLRPDLQFDDAGTLHVIWSHYPPATGGKPVFYAAYREGVYRVGQETVVVTPRVTGTTALEGPHLGLDRQYAYILWSMTFFTGLEAGTAQTEYVYFPKGQPSPVSPAQQLTVPFSFDLPYQSFQAADVEAGPRVPLGPEFRGGGSYIVQVNANPNYQQELVIAFHAQLGYLMQKIQSQVSVAFLQDGVPTSYQMLSFSPGASDRPFIYSDETGRLYLTWLEKGSLPGWVVYFASTAPDIRQALNDLTPDDYGRLSAETIFGMLSGVLLIPFALAWIMPALIVLLLTSPIRDIEERLTSAGTIISLILSLVALWIIKLVFLPGIVDYVPFSVWIPGIPSGLGSLLRLGMPVLIAGFALLAGWYFTYRRGESSVFHLMIAYAVVDGILTLAIYGVVVYAVL